MSEASFQDWIGRTETATDVAAAGPCSGLAATLDHVDAPWRPGEVPPLGHWLYFHSHARQSGLGPDGHAKRGEFLPPVPLPRRMWAAGELEFLAPIPFGSAMKRVSTITGIQNKTGKSGEMVFVKVAHVISIEGSVRVREVHTIVYRGAPDGSASGTPAQADKPPLQPGQATDGEMGLFRRDIVPDPVLLFRYSALTFNGHRIHYDRSYCERVEGYPGLVVHGPLTATLLMDLYLRQRPGAAVKSFRFRALSPLFDIHPFSMAGEHRKGGAMLRALDNGGATAMAAELEIA